MLEKENEKVVTYRSTASTPGLGGPPQQSSGAPNKPSSVAGYAGVSPLPINSINSPASLGTAPKSKEAMRRKSISTQATGPAVNAGRKNQSEPVTPIGPMTPASGSLNRLAPPSALSTVTETPLEASGEQADRMAGKTTSAKRVKRLKKMPSANNLGTGARPSSPSLDNVLEAKNSKRISRAKPKKSSGVSGIKVSRIARSAGTTPLTTEDVLPGSTSSNDTGSNVFPASVATDPTPQTDFDPLGQNDPTLGTTNYDFEDDDIFNIDSGLLDKSAPSKAQSTTQSAQRPQDDLPIDEPFNLDFLDPASTMNYNDLNQLNWQ